MNKYYPSRSGHGQRGFTLVELIAAISIFMILMLAATSLYTTVLKGYVKDKAVQSLQREGDAILAHMSLNLKEAVSVNSAASDFTVDPNMLTVNLSSANKTRKYYVTGSQIHFVDENGSDTNLMSPASTVSSLVFTPTTDTDGKVVSIKIRGSLSHTKNGATVSLTIGSSISPRPQ